MSWLARHGGGCAPVAIDEEGHRDSNIRLQANEDEALYEDVCGATLTCRSKPVTRLPSDPGAQVMGTSVETMTAVPAAGTEAILAEILADVMHAERVPVDGHFFDDWVPIRW